MKSHNVSGFSFKSLGCLAHLIFYVRMFVYEQTRVCMRERVKKIVSTYGEFKVKCRDLVGEVNSIQTKI